jgi:dTDP-4-amino-4,6-dideoxygalactose transaminase
MNMSEKSWKQIRKSEMIPLVKPFMPPRDVLMPALENILYSGYIAEGEAVYQFEDTFRQYVDNPYCLAVNSGTAALHLAYLLENIKAGDEIISTPMTAEPTNTTIAVTGAKVVWGDVDPNNGLLDPKSVRNLITEKTKAIVLVHYAGMVCDMDEFNQLSKEYNIPVIEDAAHALGSKYRNKMTGLGNNNTIFSFQAIKHMTTVDGGILALTNGTDMERARKLRWFGLDKKKSRLENDITEAGYKYGMNNVNAAIGNVQMRYLDSIINTHISNGKYYDAELKDMSGIELPNYSNHTEPSYWLYTMKVERREDFIKMMESNGVTASTLHHRNDTHSVFKPSERELPNMETFYNSFVHIPCGWWVTEEDRERIAALIKKGW